MAVETFVQVPPNAGDRKVATTRLSNGADDVDLQSTILRDPASYTRAARIRTADPVRSEDGLVVRPLVDPVRIYRSVLLDGNNADVIKNSAGVPYGWFLHKREAPNYYEIFVKLYNKATPPDPALDTPLLVIPVQAGRPANLFVESGFDGFTNGIAILVVKGIADSDDAPVIVDDGLVQVFFK